MPAELLAAEPGADWPEIARFRDHLTHHYWDTDHAIRQHVIDVGLGDLAAAVQRLPDRATD